MQAYTSTSQNRASLRSIASPDRKKPSTTQKTSVGKGLQKSTAHVVYRLLGFTQDSRRY